MHAVQPVLAASLRRLGVSPRTLDVYRARLMRKVGAATTPELVHKLLAG